MRGEKLDNPVKRFIGEHGCEFLCIRQRRERQHLAIYVNLITPMQICTSDDECLEDFEAFVNGTVPRSVPCSDCDEGACLRFRLRLTSQWLRQCRCSGEALLP